MGERPMFCYRIKLEFAELQFEPRLSFNFPRPNPARPHPAASSTMPTVAT